MKHNEKGLLDLSHNIYYGHSCYMEGQRELAERARRINSLRRFSLKEEAIKIGYKW